MRQKAVLGVWTFLAKLRPVRAKDREHSSEPDVKRRRDPEQHWLSTAIVDRSGGSALCAFIFLAPYGARKFVKPYGACRRPELKTMQEDAILGLGI